ncbi:uncharacterized protein B0P05DRAFT_552012 [Gilbertella persicaria]|uniref:uncharacterized protein n=1 Tax=Gilbertella persicaria TaxID=101096 RepID=UPI00221FC6B9|nr:uncharacterized protein B0P05DRAFT_552012 [Gilbertella persicaria]KAI8068151.1 hypothetical protein B0P05DRAFT_552012 [Gilbertella persicaria]
MASHTQMNEGFFAVKPKTDCPHIPHYEIKEKEPDLFHQPCGACNETKENWQCFHCRAVYCSRYCQGHMKQHAEETGHAVCISYSDLSVWCFKCDAYIIHKDLQPMKTSLYRLKFDQ